MCITFKDIYIVDFDIENVTQTNKSTVIVPYNPFCGTAQHVNGRISHRIFLRYSSHLFSASTFADAAISE